MLGTLSAFFFALTAVSTSAHAQPLPPLDSIVGGSEVRESDPVAATTVAIQGHDSEGSYLCSGSIIAQDLVVTAGHCLSDDGSSLTILFRRDVHGTGEKVTTDGGMRPENYYGGATQKREHFDIALLHFQGGLPEGYRPVQVLENESEIRDGTEVILAGYGDTVGMSDLGLSSGGTHGTLRKTHVSIAQADFNAGEFRTDESHGKGSCNGDSGGPALLETSQGLVLAGLTSRGDPSCEESGTYTKLPAFKSWLAKAAAELRERR
jgi:secreted trypsin-like serine protease